MTDHRITVHFEGTLTLESPYANAPKDDKRDKSLPQALPRMTIDLGGAKVAVPYVSGGAIRGRLRRIVAPQIAEEFRARGAEMTLSDHMLIALGGVKGSGEREVNLETRRNVVENCAHLALFGAGEGPRQTGMLASQLFIGHAIPDHDVEAVVVRGARAHEDRSNLLFETLPAEEIAKAINFSKLNSDRAGLKGELKALRNDLKKARKDNAATAAIDAAIAEKEEALARAEESQNEALSDNSIGMPLAGYEVIPQGTRLPHRMSLNKVLPHEAGYFLGVLASFARNPMLGAHAAHGCGLVSARYDVRVLRGLPSWKPVPSEHIGSVSWSTSGADGHRLIIEGAELEAWLDAWVARDFDPKAWRA